MVLRLLVQHRNDLYAFVLMLCRDPHMTEEVLQDASVIICEQWQDYTEGSNFMAWARTIARNLVRTKWREQKRGPQILDDAAIEALEVALIEQPDEQETKRLQTLHRCRQRLTPRARTILEMRYQGAASCEKIAEELQCSNSVVRSTLSRARRALAYCVKQSLLEGQVKG